MLQGQKVSLSLSLSIPLSFPHYPPFSLSLTLSRTEQTTAHSYQYQSTATQHLGSLSVTEFLVLNQSTTARLYCLSDKLHTLLDIIHTHMYTRAHMHSVLDNRVVCM